MNVKRYFAKTAREALRALKAELGADAIVLSNRAVGDGVEILALPAEAVGAAQASAPAARPLAPPEQTAAPAARPGVQSYRNTQADAEADADFHVSLSRRDMPPAAAVSPATPVIRAFNPPRMETPDYLMRKRDEAAALRAENIEARRGEPEQRGRQPRREERPVTRAPMPSVSTGYETDDYATDADDHHAGGFADERSSRAAAWQTADDRAPAREPSPRAAQPELQRQAEPQPAPRPAIDDHRLRTLEEANGRLMSELAGIRNMIERQLAGFAWGETRRNAPARAEIVGELLEAGFAGPMARELAAAVAEGATLEEARKCVGDALARDLRAMSCDADLIDRGGVYALVGATGVGKTTTTAKIAARCVVRHGAEKLALITTDGYRIGAQEQLRIYGRILGVPVFPVRDAADLRQTLAELRNKHMVLIDTVGVSQRDRMVAEQIAMLSGAGSVRRLLLLNATCRGDTLDDVVNAYRGDDLAGCILTKVDEAASLAPAIGAAIAHKLEVFYVTNGQRVPEDLHLPNRSYLLHRALRPGAEDSPWKLRPDEAALMMAARREA